MIRFTQGDMFEAPADIRVNTVNCVGVMGAGVALAFKNRYPAMFREYKRECTAGNIEPGKMHVWRELDNWVIQFPHQAALEGKIPLRGHRVGAGGS